MDSPQSKYIVLGLSSVATFPGVASTGSVCACYRRRHSVKRSISPSTTTQSITNVIHTFGQIISRTVFRASVRLKVVLFVISPFRIPCVGLAAFCQMATMQDGWRVEFQIIGNVFVICSSLIIITDRFLSYLEMIPIGCGFSSLLNAFFSRETGGCRRPIPSELSESLPTRSFLLTAPTPNPIKCEKRSRKREKKKGEKVKKAMRLVLLQLTISRAAGHSSILYTTAHPVKMKPFLSVWTWPKPSEPLTLTRTPKP